MQTLAHELILHAQRNRAGDDLGHQLCIRRKRLAQPPEIAQVRTHGDRKSTRLNSSHTVISYAVFCLKKKHTECRYMTHKRIQCSRSCAHPPPVNDTARPSDVTIKHTSVGDLLGVIILSTRPTRLVTCR